MALLVGELKSVLELDTSQYDKGLDRSHAKFGKFVKAAGVMSAAAAVAAGAGLLKLAKGAAEDEAAQKVLATTLKNTAGATDAQVASIENYISKTGAATGVTDDQMRPALANLVRATKDVGKAQGLMGLAMDVSAGTGKDLGAVTQALAKAQNGNVGGLARLGIATKDAHGKTKSFEQIQKDLAATFKGQSAAAAETTAGKFARLKLIVSEAGETVGSKLLPVINALGGWLLNVGIPALSRFGEFAKREILPPLRAFAASVGEVLLPKLQSLAGFIISTVVPVVQKYLVGVLAGARSAFESVRKSIQENEPQLRTLVAAIGTVVKWVAEKLGPILGWLAKTQLKLVGRHIAGMISAIGWLVNAVKGASKAIGDAAAWIGKKWGEIKAGGASLLAWFKALPGNVAKALGNTGRILVQKGRDLISGLWNGLGARWTDVGKWLGDRGNSAVRWVGSVARILYQKGRDVISGFWSGLGDRWRDVTKWVGGIATWIKDHKGPVSLDGRLLIPAGRAIMSGFLSGLKSGAGPAWNFVQSVGGKTKDALAAVFGGPFMGGGDPAPTNLSAMQALVRTVAAQRGWGSGAQWDALYQLVQHESGFNPNAQNPTSTAYGLFQFLNSTWGAVGASKTSDPWGQTSAGLRYIANSYGSPAAAWSAWQSRSPHWYAKGTPWVPNDQLAFVHRGEAIVPAEVNRRARGGGGGGAVVLDGDSIDRLARAISAGRKKDYVDAMREAKFRVVSGGGGGSYILQMSNG